MGIRPRGGVWGLGDPLQAEGGKPAHFPILFPGARNIRASVASPLAQDTFNGRKAVCCTYPVNILKLDCSRSDQRSVTSNNFPIRSGTSLNYIRLVQGTNHHASCDQPSQQPGIHPLDCNVLFIVVCLVTLIKGLQGSLLQLVQ